MFLHVQYIPMYTLEYRFRLDISHDVSYVQKKTTTRLNAAVDCTYQLHDVSRVTEIRGTLKCWFRLIVLHDASHAQLTTC